MEPERFSPAFEAEVAAINTEIASRRSVLEREAGIESAASQEIAKAAIGNALHDAAQAAAAPADPAASSGSYLDHTDPATAASVNALIDEIQEKGIAAAIADARTKDPYILDAFHDALVDKLYDALSQRGLI
ncbi:MAG TPA: hypothetical protein VFL98_03500 [Candidatus Paceibacterota bacterium]|nr:hypothetical protein [Candidatus Paceibacterota bacterium]